MDAAAFAEWASAGCAGPAPDLRISERRKTAERLAVATARNTASAQAIEKIDAEIFAANEAARKLSAKIDVEIFDDMIAGFDRKWAEMQAAFDVARLKAADCLALHLALYERANQMRNEGKDVMILHNLERLVTPNTDVAGAPTNGEVAAALEIARADIRSRLESAR
jgi:hypothetical protein